MRIKREKKIRKKNSVFLSAIADQVQYLKTLTIDNGKFFLPIILVALSAFTCAIAFNARDRVYAATSQASVVISDTVKTVRPVLYEEFEEDGYSNVNELIADYYEALETGDMETLTYTQNLVTNTELIRLRVMSEYVDRYDNIKVYTKPGPYENTYLAYVYSEVYLKGRNEYTPGLQAFYICEDEHGNCYINANQLTEEEISYIAEVAAQSDVIDLKNTVNVNYNTIMSENDELSAHWADISVEIDLAVGEQLSMDELLQAQLNGENKPEEEEVPDETTTAVSNGTVKVRTTASVYVRKSASATADKLGTVNAGTTFVLREELINGWSLVTYEKKDGYIKTEFLEKLENVNDLSVVGRVTATTGLNVRSDPKQTAKKLGTLGKGESADLVLVQDGWCKIIYKGEVAYVKADYVTMN